MQTTKTVLLILLCLIVLIPLFISIQYPFTRETVPLMAGMLRKPDIQKADPSIETLAELETFIDAQFEASKIQGMSVAIVQDGRVAWQKGYGYADVERGLAASADTPFMIGSISKAVTGVTLMHAVEAGWLDLDWDINTYLSTPVHNPHRPNEAITLRHLATHTSGIVDREWVYTNSYEYGDATQTLAGFVDDYFQENGRYYSKRNFSDSAPGEVSEYSNIATGLAGQVLHEATGTRLDAYGNEHIFAPLGMQNTGWFLSDFEDESTLAVPYVRGNRPFPHYGYPTWPEGQLRTSASDLARLLAMVMNGGELDGVRVLDEATVDALLEKQDFLGLADVSGEGIFWSYTKQGLVGHNGGDFGVFSMMYFDPETGVGAVVLTNASPGNAVGPVATIVRQAVENKLIVNSE